MLIWSSPSILHVLDMTYYAVCKSFVVFLQVKDYDFEIVSAVCAGELAMYCEESSFLCGQNKQKIAS